MIWEIRKLYNVHPVLDSECDTSWFNNKDSILFFKDYLQLTLNDADYESDDPELPLSLKLIKFKKSIVIFAEDDMFCIDKLFRTKDSQISSNKIPRRLKTLVPYENDEERAALEILDFCIEIGEEYGCDEVDCVFNKILEAIYCRLETFILDTDLNARKCMDQCKLQELNERIKFYIMLSANQKRLIYLSDLIDPKVKILKKMIASKVIVEDMKYYLKSFLSKTVTFQQRLRMSKSMLNTAENIHSVQVDEALQDYSNKLTTVSRYFSSIAAMFLPLVLMTSYFGMNVLIPGELDNSYDTFLSMVYFSIALLVVLVIYFKIKKWL